MSDERDIEQSEQQFMAAVDREIAAIRAKVPSHGSSPWCACGNEIHPLRANAGYGACIECARAAEVKGKLYGVARCKS